MFQQYFADEDEADALAVWFGGEEGAEQFGFGDFVDTFSRVGDLQAGGMGGGEDVDITVLADGFGGVLDNVYQDLLKQGTVQVYDRGFRA